MEVEEQMKKRVEAYRLKTESETERELSLLKKEAEQERLLLKKNYTESSERLAKNALESVLRSLEE